MGTAHLEQVGSHKHDPVSAYMHSCEAEASKHTACCCQISTAPLADHVVMLVSSTLGIVMWQAKPGVRQEHLFHPAVYRTRMCPERPGLFSISSFQGLGFRVSVLCYFGHFF